MPAYCQWHDNTLTLTCHVQPRASRDEWAGLHGDALKVRITAPPLEGKANAHLLAFIAASFGVSKQKVSLLTGDSGRHKRIAIQAPEKIPDALQALITLHPV